MEKSKSKGFRMTSKNSTCGSVHAYHSIWYCLTDQVHQVENGVLQGLHRKKITKKQKK